MLSCKGVLGVEGGASLLDFDGSLDTQVKHYLEKNPNACFEEVEKHCFPGKDGNLNLKALSPRHLEACATKTCQLLVEGDYSGILKPDIHYIPIKEDFSNVDEALLKFKDDTIRNAIVENAFNDIVLSQKYFLSSFVKTVLDASEIKNPSPAKPLIFYINVLRETFLKKRIRFEFWFWKKIKKWIPRTIETKIKLLRNRAT